MFKSQLINVCRSERLVRKSTHREKLNRRDLHRWNQLNNKQPIEGSIIKQKIFTFLGIIAQIPHTKSSCKLSSDGVNDMQKFTVDQSFGRSSTPAIQMISTDKNKCRHFYQIVRLIHELIITIHSGSDQLKSQHLPGKTHTELR